MKSTELLRTMGVFTNADALQHKIKSKMIYMKSCRGCSGKRGLSLSVVFSFFFFCLGIRCNWREETCGEPNKRIRYITVGKLNGQPVSLASLVVLLK